MKYAVVKIKGLQFKVGEGDEIVVNRLAGEGEIDLKDVLLTRSDKEIKIGKPLVEQARVKAKIIRHFLGKKLDVFKFKAKTGYRRKLGFRSRQSLLKIEKITS